MKIKLLGVITLIAVLGACSHKDDQAGMGAATGTGGAGMNGNSNGYGANGAMPGSQEDLVASAGDRVFFDTANNTLNSEAQGTLDRQAGWLQRYPQVSVQIAGNCDERGTEEYNLALGNRRANAARDYLAARGVSSARMSVISYGKDRPTATGADQQSFSQNRNAITSVR